MKKRLMVLAMAGIMVTGLVSSANIVSADDKEASGLEGKRIGVCLVYKGDEWCAAVADEFEKWHGLECIECGSCSFACPAKRQLAQSIKTMKKQVLAAKRKK